MGDKLKPLLKRIDDLCTPIFKLGGEKGVKAKDLEKNFNKGPLSELAFDLLSCLNETKRQLQEHDRHLAKATSAMKEQDSKIQALDTSLAEKESAEESTMAKVLTEVKKNGDCIADIKAAMEQNQEKIAEEATKVSSYAEILKKSVSGEKSINLPPKRFAQRVISEMKASDRKKNLILYGVSGHVDKITDKIDYQEELDDILNVLGFSDVQPTNVELIKPGLNKLPDKTEDGEPIPCTIRVQLPNEGTAFKMLKNAPLLKPTRSLNHVYIAPDRTPAEQKARVQLVEKLKLRIKQQPMVKWGIRRGEIVDCGRWEGRTRTAD